MRLRCLLPILALLPAAAFGQESCPLRSLSARTDVAIGAAFVEGSHEATFREVLRREFASTTAGTYWQTVQPTRGTFDFSVADDALATAEAAGLRVRGHPLVWGRLALPAWVNAITDPADLRSVMTQQIQALVGRYRGRVDHWDVVNEPLTFLGDPGTTDGLESYVFLRLLGPAYIADALAAAHAADPDARLFINDFFVLRPGPKQDRLFRLAQELLAAGAPLHGVGFQGHVTPPFGPTFLPTRAEMEATMRRFTALGLAVEVTELDVSLLNGSGACRLDGQRDVYHAVVAACLAVPGCSGVTVWGITDKHTWIDNFFGTRAAPLPFDTAYAPKPAYFGMREALADVVCDAPGDCPAACDDLGPARPRCCVTAADCDDGDPCTVETCSPDTGCAGTPLGGLDGAACTCERAAPAACDAGLPAIVASHIAESCRRIALARDGTPGRARRDLARAATRFTRARHAVDKLARRAALTPSCAAALDAALRDARERTRSARP